MLSSVEETQAALHQIIGNQLVINVHEHMQDAQVLTKWLPVMNKFGISRTILVGSSRFTITLNPKEGFRGYKSNNENILSIAKKHPARFDAWPTIDPQDPKKAEYLQQLIERGAKGLKLYSGHGFINPHTKRYLFHTIALDHPTMLPVYEFCERNFIPILFHVNPGPTKPGFCQEFVEVLTMFPDLKINCPHFMLSSIYETRLREFLDTFPNLYTDISFGHDDHLIAALKRVSHNPLKFERLFRDYPDRFMFGTDLVATNHPRKTVEWYGIRIKAYFDMLFSDVYSTALVPRITLRGLVLPKEIMHNLLYRNYERFVNLRPRNRRLKRDFDWSRAGVKLMKRSRGQSFHPYVTTEQVVGIIHRESKP